MEVGVEACSRLMKVASEGAVSIRDSSHRGISKCVCCRYPRPYWRHPRIVAAPIGPFWSRGHSSTHRRRARVSATVALA